MALVGIEKLMPDGYSKKPEPKVERIAPSVLIDGQIVTPPGWVWILGYAMAGFDWAITEVEKPEFKLQYREWLTTTHKTRVEEEIKALEERLSHLKSTLVK